LCGAAYTGGVDSCHPIVDAPEGTGLHPRRQVEAWDSVRPLSSVLDGPPCGDGLPGLGQAASFDHSNIPSERRQDAGETQGRDALATKHSQEGQEGLDSRGDAGTQSTEAKGEAAARRASENAATQEGIRGPRLGGSGRVGFAHHILLRFLHAAGAVLHQQIMVGGAHPTTAAILKLWV
jgi:hypothetical protein